MKEVKRQVSSKNKKSWVPTEVNSGLISSLWWLIS